MTEKRAEKGHAPIREQDPLNSAFSERAPLLLLYRKNAASSVELCC
jgi:hypothetical protein